MLREHTEKGEHGEGITLSCKEKFSSRSRKKTVMGREKRALRREMDMLLLFPLC